MEKVSKKYNLISKIVSIALIVTIAFFGGYYIPEIINQSNIGSQNLIITIILVLLFLIIAYVLYLLHIIIHESGHYAFGRLTGYTFVSFRVGSFTLVKNNGHLKFKRFNIPGTMGQCLLMPPNKKEGEFPFLLYNLGGIIGNIIWSGLSLILLILLPEYTWLSIILLTNSVIGILMALFNSIALKSDILNDGMNIYILLKDRYTRDVFWLLLYLNAFLTKGERLRDLSEKWFDLPIHADTANPLVSNILLFRVEYFMDKMDFKKAKTECQFILENERDLPRIQKMELSSQLLFLEIIDECRMDKIQQIFTKDLKQYIDETKNTIFQRRLLYAYELLVNQDKRNADEELDEFKKLSRNYPVPSEVEREREIIKVIQSKYFYKKEVIY